SSGGRTRTTCWTSARTISRSSGDGQRRATITQSPPLGSVGGVMTRRIELELEGVSAVARLLDEVAPETTRSLWELLPLEETLRHLAWAGEGVWISTRRLRDANLPLENRVSFYHPGMINCRPESGEIAFCYGQ